jgi:hypothetical protein
MSAEFATGKKAFGFCDRCGFRCKLSRMKSETVRGLPVNNSVCPACWDKDHPQNFQGMYPVVDAQALESPRPDPSLAASRVIIPGPYTMDDIP